MTRDLLLHPLPSVLRHAVQERIHAGMRVVVPNLQAGIEFQRQLGRNGSVVTLTQLARESLRQAGYQPLKRIEAQRFFEKAIENVELSYLEPIRERRSTTSVLFGLITELQRDHIAPDDLLRVAAPGRELDVALAYHAYHEACHAQRRYDLGGAEHLAAMLPEVEAQVIALYGFQYFDAAQIAFIQRKLEAGSLVTLPAADGATTTQRSWDSAERLQNMDFVATHLSGQPHSVGDRVIESFWHGTPVPEVIKSDFSDIDAEVRACLREVRSWLAAGTPPEKIALIVRQEATYLETLADVAAEYRIPLVSGAQRQLLRTGLGSLLQAWVDAHRAEWRFAATQAFLTHPLLSLPIDASERAHQLRPHSPRGLAAWSPDLTWLELPAETTWRKGLVSVVQRLITDLGVRARCRQEPPLNTALSLFFDRLRSDARRDTSCSREQILAAVGFTLRDIQLPALLGKSAVRVVNPIGALGRQFERVWLLGLSDTIFPAARNDHPLIDSFTRRVWREKGTNVPDLSHFTSVEEALFLSSVATAQTSLVLSRPRQLSGRRLSPSPLWGRVTATGTLAERPHASKLERELHLALSRKSLPQWQKGIEAERNRSAGLLTPYSGQLQAGINVADRLWTLEELKIATTCRYWWWAQYVLEVTPPTAPDWESLRRAALNEVLKLRTELDLGLTRFCVAEVKQP